MQSFHSIASCCLISFVFRRRFYCQNIQYAPNLFETDTKRNTKIHSNEIYSRKSLWDISIYLMSLLSCAPCAPTPLRALRIINTRFTRLYPNEFALRDFVLSCVVLLQLKCKVPMFCMCAAINHSTPSLSPFFYFTI